MRWERKFIPCYICIRSDSDIFITTYLPLLKVEILFNNTTLNQSIRTGREVQKQWKSRFSLGNLREKYTNERRVRVKTSSKHRNACYVDERRYVWCFFAETFFFHVASSGRYSFTYSNTQRVVKIIKS